MITVPNKRPIALRNFEVDFGTTVAEALWRTKIVQALNWLNDALPVGLILPFYQSQLFANGNPLPDPIGLLQFCDGAAVLNPDSPLYGQNVPDLRNLFLKGGTTIGVLGGSETLNLGHNHSGLTGSIDDGDFSEQRIDDGSPNQEHHAHRHFIGGDLGLQSLLPPYVDLQYYMKVDGAASVDASITYPQLDDDLAKYGKIVATELLQSIKAAIDYINAACPIGDVIPIMTNIPGVSVNPKIFQECDGSEITDPDSPLRSLPGTPRFTSNLVSRYIKFPTIGVVGSPGGQNSRSDLGHDHDGRTATHEYDDNCEVDTDHFPSTGHFHTISRDLDGTFNTEPPYYTVKFFMRIQ